MTIIIFQLLILFLAQKERLFRTREFGTFGANIGVCCCMTVTKGIYLIVLLVNGL